MVTCPFRPEIPPKDAGDHLRSENEPSALNKHGYPKVRPFSEQGKKGHLSAVNRMGPKLFQGSANDRGGHSEIQPDSERAESQQSAARKRAQ